MQRAVVKIPKTTFSAVVLAAAGLFLSAPIHAQTRGATRASASRPAASPEEKQAREIARLDSWLRRLRGRFRLEGDVTQLLNDGVNSSSSKATGTVDCSPIGSGPGTRCMLNVKWAPIGMLVVGPVPWRAYSEQYNTMQPAVLLLGMDERGAGIHFQLVDSHGIAEGAAGELGGDALIYKSIAFRGCGPGHCPRSLRIDTRSGSDVVRLEMTWPTYQTRFNFTLGRISEAGTDASDN